jgi:multiple antibiotic resistance protein
MHFDSQEILAVTIVLFSIIDVIGAVPIIIDLKKKAGDIHPERATIVSGFLMIGFLYLGKNILKLFGVDVNSFAIAGAFILLLIGLEMILGRNIFKHETSNSKATTIVPLVFPIIIGAGTMTTLISLKAAYQEENIIIGICLNLIIIYTVLRSLNWIEKKIGVTGADILRKVFGIIIFAIAIKLIKTNL